MKSSRIILSGAIGILTATGLSASPAVAQTGNETIPLPMAIRISPYTYTSAPLLETPLGPWRRVQISGRTMNEAVLSLDPNRIVWDGYSPSWASTRMAEMRVRVKLKEVKKLPVRRTGKAKVYDVEAQDLPRDMTWGDLNIGKKLRLVVGENPSGPFRLLVLNEMDRIERVVSLERESPIDRTPIAEEFDLQTATIIPPTGRTTHIRLKGSLASGKASLIMDANAVVLDAYGDVGISTLMAPLPTAVTLTEKTDISDEAKPLVRVYDIEGASAKMRLVIAKQGGPNRLLLLNDDGRVTRYLPLESVMAMNADTTKSPLQGTAWRLEKIQYNDGKIITPPANLNYTLEFMEKGRIAGRADSNRVMGGYTAGDRDLTFKGVASTRMASLPGSIASDYFKALGEVSSYTIRGTQLILMLKVDSGSIIFNRDTPTPR